MHFPSRGRARPFGLSRRGVAIAAGLLAGCTIVGTLAIPERASANTRSWEINSYRHVSYNQNEAGSDEIYLAAIWFRFIPGDPSSVKVGRQGIGVVDSIDQGEYHTLKDGQHVFEGLHDWSVDELFTDRGPEVVGMVTQVMEHDKSSTEDRRRVMNSVVDAATAALKDVAYFSGPLKVSAGVFANTIADLLANRTMNGEVENAVRQYLTGAVTNAALDAFNRIGVRGTIRTLRDDMIGSPKVHMFVSMPRWMSDLTDPIITQYTDDYYIGTLRPRSWEHQYEGNDTRYGLYGRTASLNSGGGW